MFDLIESAKRIKIASTKLFAVENAVIDNVLKSTIRLIKENANYIKKQNAIDVENARKNNKSESFIDRLILSDKVIDGIIDGVENVIKLESSVGKEIYRYNNEYQGIEIVEKAVPFGVIGIIYEARPNVTVDAFALSIKTKNAVMLRGGSDAINSNIAIVKVLKMALKENNLSEDLVMLVEDTSREVATKFMRLNGYIDLLIPRGSKELIKSTIENATVSVIETGAGNCHIYVDKFADIDKAVNIIFNAKTQRYGVCNACESLVIHSDILEKALPKISEKLSEKNVQIRCDERAIKYVKNGVMANEEDFCAEYCDAIISVKVVDNIDEAIEHINRCSTHHSESIITEKVENAKKFMQEIDSSTVYHNASTRFTDGFVFGFGAEIGISTQKLHARGPLGLNALVTTKYFVCGNGAVRK